METRPNSMSARLFLVLLMAGLSIPRLPSASPAPRRLACLGDSNTKRGYPEILDGMLGDGWRAENYGIGAATVLGGTLRPYAASDEYGRALASEPDVVIVMLGTNDANPKWWDAQAARDTDFEGPVASEFRHRYLELIADLRALATIPEIIIATPLPVYPGRANERNRENAVGRRDRLVNDVIPLIREVAAEANVPLVDVHGRMEGSAALSTDGVHFKTVGYKKMCGAFVEALRELDE